MISIKATNIYKAFGEQLIVKNFSIDIAPCEFVAITGNNGAGKSTLLKLLAGFIKPDKGNVIFFENERTITNEYLISTIAFAAPYVELPEELTLQEFLKFHEMNGNKMDKNTIDKLSFGKHKNKLIASFSSGMKQKLKLALAFYGNKKLILLDEPTSNLDSINKSWYQEEVSNSKDKVTIIIASNEKEEFKIASKEIAL